MQQAGLMFFLIWEIKSFSEEHVLSNSTAVLPGHYSDSTARELCTTCSRGLHCLYSTVQRTGLKKTRKLPEMGVWAIFIPSVKTIALLQLGLLQDHCCNTSISLNNYNFKLEAATPADKDFLPVVQTVSCSTDNSVSLELSCSFRSSFTLVLTLKAHAIFVIKKCILVLSWNQSKEKSSVY